MALVDCSGWSWCSSRQVHADAVGAEEGEQGGLVFQFGAGRVAEAVAAAAVALGEHLLHVAIVLGGIAQLGADALVGIFGHGLRDFDGEAVQIEIVLVSIVLEPDPGGVARLLADGDDLEADDVALGVVDVVEEVGDALAVVLGLAGQGEAAQLRRAVLLEDDEVVALTGGLPVAVGSLRLEDVAFLGDGEHAAHDGPQFLLRPAKEVLQGLALLPKAPLELV